MTEASSEEHHRECSLVLARIQEFLDHELDEATEDAIREHLAACEPCLDQSGPWCTGPACRPLPHLAWPAGLRCGSPVSESSVTERRRKPVG